MLQQRNKAPGEDSPAPVAHNTPTSISNKGKRGLPPPPPPSASSSSSGFTFSTHLLPTLFGCDYRSLACFRVLTGALMMNDLWYRSYYLRDHYSSEGVWPNHLAVAGMDSFSVHFMSGRTGFQGALFILHAIVSFFMMIGWHTRVNTFLTWFLLVSLQNRNLYLLNGGDAFIRMMLFWAMFLPLGMRYSVDATTTSNTSPHNRAGADLPVNKYHLSMATIAAMGQFCLVYYFTAVLKTGVEWQRDYTAIYYALALDQFASKIALITRQYPSFMKLLTCLAWYWELYGPVFFFIPFSTVHGLCRTIGVAGFFALHIGIGLNMELGLFMYVPPICSTIFLPAWFWDNLSYYILRPKYSFTIYYNSRVENLDKCLALFRSFFLSNIVLMPLVANSSSSATAGDSSSSSSGASSYDHGGVASSSYDPDDNKYEKASRTNSGGEDDEDVVIPIAPSPRTTRRMSVDENIDAYEWIVVQDEITGKRFTGYEGVLHLFRASRVLWVLVPIMSVDFIQRLNETLVCRFLLNVVARKLYPSNGPVVPPQRQSRIMNLVVAWFFALIVAWNFCSWYNYPIPDSVRWMAPALRLDQYWGMFAPAPGKLDGWMYMPGVLADGTEVNVFEGFGFKDKLGDPRVEIMPDGSRKYHKPPLVSHQFPLEKWRKYLMNVQLSNHNFLRLPYGQYLCREWNHYGKHPPNKLLKQYKIIYVTHLTPDPGDTEPVQEHPVELWNHVCY